GSEWPQLMRELVDAKQGAARAWGIRQKQTGADRLSIGGALAANAHGRGLKFKPFIRDVESFVLVDADGTPRTCSREENAELFRLAIGGYGLFRVITASRVRLAPRVKVTHQLGPYLDDYHRALDRRLGASEPATELITEIYAPRDALVRFLTDVRERFRAQRTALIYGTIRLIERDDESFLAWAKQPYACVI